MTGHIAARPVLGLVLQKDPSALLWGILDLVDPPKPFWYERDIARPWSPAKAPPLYLN